MFCFLMIHVAENIKFQIKDTLSTLMDIYFNDVTFNNNSKA